MRASLVLLPLLILACAEPGFMAARPYWARSEVPMRLCVSAYSGDSGETEGARKLTAYALDVVFAKRLGFKLFTMEPVGSSTCDATLVVGAPRDVDWSDAAGTCEFDPARRSGLRCSMSTSNTGTDDRTTLVIEHELGHCAGLDHDTWEGSIMFPEVHDTPDGVFPPWIDDWDRSLLRQTYGP